MLLPEKFSFTSMYFKIIVLLAILIILCYKYLYQKCKRNPSLVEFSKMLPGPTPFPFLGNSLGFFQDGTRILKKMIEYSKCYGHIYRLWFGTHLMVVLSKAEDLEVVFMNSNMLGKAQLFRSFQVFWGDGIFSGPKHIWKHNRRRLQPIFGNNLMQFYAVEFNKKIYNLIDIMEKLIDGPEFDAWNYLPYLSFNIIVKTTINTELELDKQHALQFHNYVKTATTIAFSKIFRPWLRIKPIHDLFFREKEIKISNAMMNFVHENVKEQLKDSRNEVFEQKIVPNKLNERGTKSFLTTLYEMKEETGSNEKIIYDEILTMLSGGTDTVGITLCFLVLVVAIHQDIQVKLFEEINTIFKNSDRRADNDDVKHLPYLDQVIKECLRRFTLIPFIFRDVEANCKIGDYIFPPGTEIMISIFNVHFNPKYYPDPWKFNPENFSPEAVKKRHKLTFLPFGAGPRNCIGQNYAMLEMKLTLIATLRKFSFHTTVKMEDIKMNMGFLLTSVNGYKISIKARNSTVT